MSQSHTLDTVAVPNDAANKSWSIRNISKADIVIIAAYAGDDATEQVYEQSLRDLKTTDGLTYIKAGSEKTVATAISENEDSLQSLIIARADTLFPVKVIENAANLEADAITVTDVDVESMKLAEKFQQVVRAFPNSDLAQGFADAVITKDPVQIQAYFEATTDYQSLTLGMVMAVGTYYKVYPFIWSAYKDKYYHLHTSDGTTNTFIGAISLLNQCTAPVSVEKPLPGFDVIYFRLNDITKSTALYYSNGCFTDDIDSDSPRICLQGAFIQKSNITQNENDTNIISVLRGTVDGVDVLGYDVPEDQQDDPSFLYALLNPQGIKGWSELLGIIIGGTLLLAVLGKVAYMIEKTIKRIGTDAYQKEYEKENQEFLEKQQTLMQSDERYLNRLKFYERSKLPESFKSYAGDLNNGLIAETYRTDMANVAEIVRTQEIYVAKVVKYGSNANIQRATDSLDKIKEVLERGEPKLLADSLDQIMADFSETSAILTAEWVKIKNKPTSEMLEFDKARQAIEEYTASVKENERTRKNWEEDRIPEEIKPIVEG